MTYALPFQFHRRIGSLQMPVLMLVALLQRTPVLRLLAPIESVWVSSSLGQVLKATAVVATALGAVDTLAGATGFVMNPASPAEATVGVPFNIVNGVPTGAGFAYTGGPTTVGSYSISNLPPGLSVPGSSAGPNGSRTLNASTGIISGTPTQAGDFVVTITAFDDPNLGLGEHGSASGTYMISVESADVAPAITTQPVNVTVTAGQQAAFSVTATGSPTPTYQWRKNSVNISGATSSTYTIVSTVSGDAGTYTVFVSNGVGSGVTSDNATLTVNAAPVAPSIATQPANQTVTAGQQAVFSVEVNGTAPFTYQWRKDGQNINGATGATYTIASTVSGDAAAYSVVVTNSVSSVTSNNATLTVNPATAAPSFTTQPTDQTVAAGAPVTFTAAASGNPSPTYQWKKNGVTIGGATNSNYTIASVAAGDAGDYTVVATNSVSSATSSSAHLTVIVPPSDAVITITVE